MTRNSAISAVLWTALVAGFFCLGLWVGYDNGKLYCLTDRASSEIQVIQPRKWIDI